MSSITDIRNLGPATETLFARAGITTAEHLRELGPDEAYRRVLQSGTRPHFIGYYALVMGLQGRAWNDCQGREKEKLLERFTNLKAECFDVKRSDLEKILNKIGVVPAK